MGAESLNDAFRSWCVPGSSTPSRGRCDHRTGGACPDLVD
jgi:hypothetical protein